MISAIKLDKIASFQSPTPTLIDTNKRVNLVYGLNGTGKSTICGYLQNTTDPRYANCALSFEPNTADDYEIFVYNEQFVRDTFYDKDEQPGIFTLGKENSVAEKAIKQAETQLLKCREELEKLTHSATTIRQLMATKKTAIINKIFETKKDHDKQVLDHCLAGFKNKEPFFDKVKNTKHEDVEYTFSDLAKETDEINKQDGKPKARLGKLVFPALRIESDLIWTEIVVGTGDSYLSELIQRLVNSDWVIKGISYSDGAGGKCPFCQQLLPNDFRVEVSKVFDKTYQDKIQIISSYKNSYIVASDALKKRMDEIEFGEQTIKHNKDFLICKEKLLALVNANIAIINQKVAMPSDTSGLHQTEDAISSLQAVIDAVDAEIESFNIKIANKIKSIDIIKGKFWKLIRKIYNVDIKKFEEEEVEMNGKIKIIEANGKIADAEIANSGKIISENRKLITNIDKAIENINRHIEIIGLDGFSIQKVANGTNSYRLTRTLSTNAAYKSLSEGEKTLITFLYFLEQCDGSKDQAGGLDLSKRIVVIDDPISSLSHNFVYEVAHLLHSRFFIKNGNEWRLKVRQLYVMTHSLYFLHELIHSKFLAKSVGGKLHRVSKNGFSTVTEMDAHEVQNDYQAFWQLFKTCTDTVVFSPILPNVIRNILEYYFSFVHQKEQLSEALEELTSSSSDFKPLYRYINRGSHNDPVNLSEFKEIDNTRYREMFKQIFAKTGFVDHYNTMMGLEVSET